MSWLTKKRLKEKEGTQRTLWRIRVDERVIEPMWVTIAVSPLGRATTQLTVVNSMNKWTKCTIWSVAPMSITQVSPLKVVLLTICAEKIECLKSEFPKKDIPDIEKALLGLKAIVKEAACWFEWGLVTLLAIWKSLERWAATCI